MAGGQAAEPHGLFAAANLAESFSPALMRSRGDLCGVRSTPLQRSTNIASHPLCRNDVETDPASTSIAEGSSWGLLFVWPDSAAKKVPRASQSDLVVLLDFAIARPLASANSAAHCEVSA